MIKSNKNMLRMLVALAFTMSPVIAVAACNSNVEDKAKLKKDGDLSNLKIVAPEAKDFSTVKNKDAVTGKKITTVVNAIVKTAIDKIATDAKIDTDYTIKIKKGVIEISNNTTYNLTSEKDVDRTFNITVSPITKSAKLKKSHTSSIVFPKLDKVVEKADLKDLKEITDEITVVATGGVGTVANAKAIITAVKEKVLAAVSELKNANDIKATDLEITVKKGKDNLTGDIELKSGLELSVEVKVTTDGNAKLTGEKTITVKIAQITE